MTETLRTVRNELFTLTLSDTGRTDWRGQSRLAYTLTDAEGREVFSGEDFCGSPLHADDSNATLAALLTFLSLRPGDTDREYFDAYTPEQLAWAQANGEQLSLLASELEECAAAVRGPGKFEGEPEYAPWFYPQCGDVLYSNEAWGESDTGFLVTDADRALFPELADVHAVILHESSDGFVSAEEYATAEEYDQPARSISSRFSAFALASSIRRR